MTERKEKPTSRKTATSEPSSASHDISPSTRSIETLSRKRIVSEVNCSTPDPSQFPIFAQTGGFHAPSTSCLTLSIQFCNPKVHVSKRRPILISSAEMPAAPATPKSDVLMFSITSTYGNPILAFSISTLIPKRLLRRFSINSRAPSVLTIKKKVIIRTIVKTTRVANVRIIIPLFPSPFDIKRIYNSSVTFSKYSCSNSHISRAFFNCHLKIT